MKITAQHSDQIILRELGARIAAMRLDRNLTQSELGEEAGISTSTIARLESGVVAPQFSGLLRVLRVLGLIHGLNKLVPDPTLSPVAQPHLQGRQRKRASGGKMVVRREATGRPS